MKNNNHLNNGEETELDILISDSETASNRVNQDQVYEKVFVTINKPVKDLIEEYAAGDLNRERGGVLIGRYREKNGCCHVHISAAIKASCTEASKSNIKFTHQTWEDIDRQKDQYYPNDKIVGWFHTHPGFGVFLSDYDLFIQNNFFKLPFQVAYVIDPVSKADCFFGNAEGEIRKINYTYTELTPAFRSGSLDYGGMRSSKYLWGACSVLALLVFVMVWIIYSSGIYRDVLLPTGTAGMDEQRAVSRGSDDQDPTTGPGGDTVNVSGSDPAVLLDVINELRTEIGNLTTEIIYLRDQLNREEPLAGDQYYDHNLDLSEQQE